MHKPNGTRMKLFFIALALFAIIQSCYSATPTPAKVVVPTTKPVPTQPPKVVTVAKPAPTQPPKVVTGAKPATPQECHFLPPGFERLRHGVDAETFDMFPPDLSAPESFVKPIFDFTCNQKKKWMDPYTNTAYDLPDQIASVTKEDTMSMDLKIDYHNDYQEYSQTKSKKSGWGIPGLFGHSESSKSSMQYILQDHRVMTEVSAHVSAYRVKLIYPAAEHVGEDMNHDYKNLPPAYIQNPALYQKFLNDYGTHFFQEALFGGLMKMDSFTSKYYSMTHTAEVIESQGGFSFFGLFGVGGGHSTAEQKVDALYKANSIIHGAFYGGTADLMKDGLSGFNNWKASVQKNPWLCEGHMQPITSFLPGGLKMTAVQTAITVKFDKVYLDELSTRLQYLKKTLYINVNIAQANNFDNQLNVEKAKPVPLHDRVLQLGKQIDDFIRTERAKPPKRPCPRTIIRTVVGRVIKIVLGPCILAPTCICSSI
jgi:hypothetical protein